MCTRHLGEFRFNLFVTSTTPLFLPLGPRVCSVGQDSVSYALHLLQASGDAAAIPGQQLFGQSLMGPATPTEATGSYNGTAGSSSHASYDSSGQTSKFWYQPGVWVKLDGGSTPGFIDGVLAVAIDTNGSLIGERDIEVSPAEDTSHPNLYTIGPMVPRLGATNFRAVISGNEVSDMAWRFYARLANDPNKPIAMEGLGTGFTDFSPSSGLVELNTGNLSVTGLTSFSSYQLLQFILALKMKNSGANPTGFFKVIGALER